MSLKIIAGHERQVALPGTIAYFIGEEAELHSSLHRDDDGQNQIDHLNCLSCSSGTTKEDCSMLSRKQEHWWPHG